jgi:hypothetical protein
MGDTEPDFYKEMMKELKNRLGDQASDVEFQGCYWQPILQEKEDELWQEKLNQSLMDKKKLRRWVINALGDPVAYLGGERLFYDKIHQKVRDDLSELLKNLGNNEETPLVVLAHSLGSVIISNYIWDQQHPKNNSAIGGNKFERMQTLTTFVTFGSNIPIFTLAFEPVECITFPPKDLDDNLKHVARWMNFFDPDDILGYPLDDIWDERNGTGKIEDFAINVGWWPLSESPLSHSHYWTDNDLTKPVADQIKKILAVLS